MQVFTGLLTVTNEKGEIRVCDLVATKAHSQFELALKRMRESLDLFGHPQPTLFYTDNMSDKQFLEESFPSLRNDVVPIQKHAHLDPLLIPADVQIHIKRTSSAIDDAVRTILEFLPVEGNSGTIVVAFDSEWNVDMSEHGHVSGRGQTALVQIAHENCVYILQVFCFH